MSQIIKDNQLREWYFEVLKHHSFLNELTNYQKDKLLNFVIKDKFEPIFQLAENCRITWEKDQYPEHISSEDQRFIYILNTTFKNPLKERIYFLNLLGWNWTPEKSFHRLKLIKELQQPDKAIDFEEGISKNIFEGIKSFFNEDQHNQLKLVLEGGKPKEKLIFNGNKNQIPELIKCLEYNNLILLPTTKKSLAYWIFENFTTNKGDFSSVELLNEQLTKTGFYVYKKKRICPEFERYSEEVLKEYNEKNRK